MENLTFAVLAIAGGGLFAALIPRVIRTQRGTVFEKTLVGMIFAGGACVFLGLGGMVIASLAPASTVTNWLGGLALIGVGVILLSALGKMTLLVQRRVAAKRT